MIGRGWFLFRALLALGMMVGFYALALGMALALVSLPYIEFVHVHRVHFAWFIVCTVGAFAILRASILLPTRRFEPPGPEVTETTQPELFRVIRETATAMRTRMPQRVYVIADVNAFVTEAGGFLGFGARRVMGIGLGLLAMNNISQLRAVIAHEFGHYVGGDTRLGGLVYSTRAAIARVLQNLGGGILSVPLEMYGKLFMRVSQAVSRGQEFAADRASVQIAGRKAHIEALERSAQGGLLFSMFAQGEVMPLLHAGYRPRNLYTTGVREGVPQGVAYELVSRSPVRVDVGFEAGTSPGNCRPLGPRRRTALGRGGRGCSRWGIRAGSRPRGSALFGAVCCARKPATALDMADARPECG